MEDFRRAFIGHTLMMLCLAALSAFATYMRGAETYIVVNAVFGGIGLSILWGVSAGLIGAAFFKPPAKPEPPR